MRSPKKLRTPRNQIRFHRSGIITASRAIPEPVSRAQRISLDGYAGVFEPGDVHKVCTFDHAKFRRSAHH